MTELTHTSTPPSLEMPSPRSGELERLGGLNRALLLQGRVLIETMSDDTFTRPVEPLSSSGIGCHFRHCLDYYRCFLDGVESGQVNYDHRHREAQLERDRDRALEVIDATLERLDRAIASGDRPLQVSGDSVGAPPQGEEEDPLIWSQSTLLRELQGLVSHTVHHYALISMLLRTLGVDPGPEFGVAPSTLEHWKQRAACAG